MCLISRRKSDKTFSVAILTSLLGSERYLLMGRQVVSRPRGVFPCLARSLQEAIQEIWQVAHELEVRY